MAETKHQRNAEILRLRNEEGLSQPEIARIYKISRQRVSYIIDKKDDKYYEDKLKNIDEIVDSYPKHWLMTRVSQRTGLSLRLIKRSDKRLGINRRLELFYSLLEEKETGCLEFTGLRHSVTEYGLFRLEDEILVHRVAWATINGKIQDGLQVLHTCDNPPCANPDHLYLGTPADNMKDRGKRGRTSHGKKLTEAMVVEARRLKRENPTITLGEIRNEVGITVGSVALYRAIRGDSWAHLPGAVKYT